MGRAPSTISREISRHGGRRRYRAVKADDRAWRNAKRPKLCLLATNLRLQRLVAGKLHDDWSPEQICGWLVSEHPDDPSLRVSHETIYRTLFIQARGVLRKELISHLRRVRSMRSSIKATHTGQGRGGIIDAVSIRDRPAEVEDRAVPGHWQIALAQKPIGVLRVVAYNDPSVAIPKLDHPSRLHEAEYLRCDGRLRGRQHVRDP